MPIFTIHMVIAGGIVEGDGVKILRNCETGRGALFCVALLGVGGQLGNIKLAPGNPLRWDVCSRGFFGMVIQTFASWGGKKTDQVNG